jgi:hypothetical protein
LCSEECKEVASDRMLRISEIQNLSSLFAYTIDDYVLNFKAKNGKNELDYRD